MKKGFIIALLCSICSYAFADTNSLELTEFQEVEYNRLKLSVETMITDFGYVDLNSGLMLSETYTKWQGYIGFEKVDEASFFAIAGYDKEAEKATDFINQNRTLTTIGVIGMTIGMVMMLGSMTIDLDYGSPEYEQESKRQDLLLYGGAGVGMIAAIPFSIGVDKSMRSWSPITLANSVADEYNYKLLIDILKRNKSPQGDDLLGI